MELKDIDLNLLVVFDRLLVERRVSRVAEALGLTQPAVSNALARLRRHLGDELFLRTSRGMEPTPLAQQLAAPVSQALSGLHAALNQRDTFDPATSRRAFTVAMTDIGEIYFLPRLMEALATRAPGIRINTALNATGALREEMEEGRIDLAIGLLPQLQGGFFQRRLFMQPYVCLLRRGHPLDRGPERGIDLQAFEAAQHVPVMSAGTGHGRVDDLLARAGVQRDVRLVVPHFVAVGHILSSTDMLATVPERFARMTTEPFRLVAYRHPASLPDIPIHVFWHARQHRDEGNAWLREVVGEVFGDG